jgi:Fur family transcriptional regulator, ferric uptake regulator
MINEEAPLFDQIVLPIQTDSDVIKLGEKNKTDEFKKVIRSMNLKVTDQRLLILESLFHSHKKSGERHVTAQELFEKVVSRDGSLGFATVYRFLRELADHAVVTEVRMGGQPSRYELTPKEHHDHLTCTKCGLICEFENDKIEKIQLQVAAHFGFQLTGHVLELYGVCPKCQKKSNHHG